MKRKRSHTYWEISRFTVEEGLHSREMANVANFDQSSFSYILFAGLDQRSHQNFYRRSAILK